MKIKGVIWNNLNLRNVAIVYGETETGERKAFIGEASGMSDEEAINSVVGAGDELQPIDLKNMLDYLTEKVEDGPR